MNIFKSKPFLLIISFLLFLRDITIFDEHIYFSKTKNVLGIVIIQPWHVIIMYSLSLIIWASVGYYLLTARRTRQLMELRDSIAEIGNQDQ